VKRLIDEDHEANSPEALLAGLVHASRSREPSPMDPRRVLRAIVAPPRSSRFASVGLGSATAALSIAAVAAASVGAIVVVGKHRTPPPEATMDTAFTHSAATGHDGLAESPLPLVALPSAAAPSETEATPPSSRSTDAPSARLRSRAKAAALHGGEDPTPVLEAIRALREDGDPARAGELLGGYLRAHPRGVLAEDALALSIEAAAARHDGRAASDLGRRYLAQFPRGRYRAFAQRAGH
jgi:hypothetical protein